MNIFDINSILSNQSGSLSIFYDSCCALYLKPVGPEKNKERNAARSLPSLDH
jgi:hypothetical protein